MGLTHLSPVIFFQGLAQKEAWRWLAHAIVSDVALSVSAVKRSAGVGSDG